VEIGIGTGPENTDRIRVLMMAIAGPLRMRGSKLMTWPLKLCVLAPVVLLFSPLAHAQKYSPGVSQGSDLRKSLMLHN
jgi:hypothetical protein